MWRRFSDSQRLAAMTLLGLAALLALVCVVKPGETSWLPQCPFLALTGFYCPGCGSTRMLYLLMHGHPWLAMRENMLGALLLPVAVVRLMQQVAGGGAMVPKRYMPRLGMAVGIVVIAFTVVRNLPAEPFRQLAPVPLAQLLRVA